MSVRAQRLRALQLVSALGSFGPYICLSCSRRGISVTYPQPKLPRRFPNTCGVAQRSSNRASSIAPVTTVNATRDVPPSVRALYNELTALGAQASIYVSLSQLQLALRGLESKDATIRVAVLAFNSKRETYGIVRALLADPLAPEQPWERRLQNLEEDDDERPLLLRYGEDIEYDQHHPLLRNLSFPCNRSRSHKLELFITQESQYDNSLYPTDASDLLTPALKIPASASGRVSTVAYPVHKVLVCGSGVSGILSMASAKASNANIFTRVANVQWRDPSSHGPLQQHVHLIDLEKATAAIAQFRKSLDNAMTYESEWLESGMPEIIEWLLHGTKVQESHLKPAVVDLIEAVLDSAERAILKEENQRVEELASASIPDSTRQELEGAISTWTEHAHTELRDDLASAFDSKAWKRITWWKLFWRVDDIGMIAGDILQRYWLTEAENEIIWVGGRIQQAGLIDQIQNVGASQSKEEQAVLEYRIGRFPPQPRLLNRLDTPATSTPTAVTHDPSVPYPQQIALARSQLSTTIPPLQSLAQRLLIHALSTTALTSSLSALMYVSISTTSVYEAGAIAALGFVYSMRRLQRRWEEGREQWVGMVREEGRKVLKSVEDVVRTVVKDGGRESSAVNEVGVGAPVAAKLAVDSVRAELRKMRLKARNGGL